MSYEMYRYIFLGALIACGIFFVVAVILFFTLRIPKVISDLTGRTAKKAIENIRLQNEQSGDKTYQTSPVNRERGKITDKISHSGRIQQRSNAPFSTGTVTEKISTQKLAPAGETDVLVASDETTLLSEPAGETVVLTAADETTVLGNPAGETTVLAATTEAPVPAEQVASQFVVEYEITFIHTSEVIS